MLKIIDSKDIISTDSALDLYPYCRIVMTDFDYDTLSGRVYAISTSPDTADDLAKVWFVLRVDGKSTALLGNYNTGRYGGILYGIEVEPV